VKKRVEAQSGASVAAVFDLCNDVLRLNLLIGLIILLAVITPSVVWHDQKEVPVEFGSNEIDTYKEYSNEFVANNYVSGSGEDKYDQYWGWISSIYNDSSEWTEFYNSSSFQCSHVDLSYNNDIVSDRDSIYQIG